MTELWQKLKDSNKPILIYGMGLGAEKVLDACEQKGIIIQDTFASDGFVRGQLFHGRRVLSYSEAKEKYKSFIVLVCFSSRLPDVIDNIFKIKNEMECYAPDVPVAGGGLFDLDYYDLHLSDFDKARQLFTDDRSKALFDDIIEFKLSGNIDLLFKDISSQDEIRNDILQCKKYKTCCDLGAYNGDSLREFLSIFPNLKKTISFEPDSGNYAKLMRFISENCPDISKAYNAAAWSSKCVMPFSREGSRNSGIKTDKTFKSRCADVSCLPLDAVCDGISVDYIKYDVEGAEKEALIGSFKTISRCRPDLLVSVYHRNEDLFALPSLVHSINPDYSLYLRRSYCIPAWELNMYAVNSSL